MNSAMLFISSSFFFFFSIKSFVVVTHYCLIYTVKALLIAQAFIRIITFHRERGGHLLEARVLTNNI